MDTAEIITAFTPALICFIVHVVTSKFPPSIDNAFISKTPQWWARDQETWDTAFSYLAKKYLHCALILVVIGGVTLAVDWEYSLVVGYVVLVVLMLVVQYQARAYMQDNIK